jgi:hypothetical protein
VLKKPEREANLAKNGLAGAEAQLILLILSARLEPCPCYMAPSIVFLAPSIVFLSKLFSRAAIGAWNLGL